MADMGEGGGGGGHDKKGKKRAKKSSTRVDMTPMVDLAFLLLTFFVMTSTFSKPKVMSLVYPAKIDEKQEQERPKINNAITFLLSKDKIFYYTGQFYSKDNGKEPPTDLTETNFGPGPNGVRKLLVDKNQFVLKEVKRLDDEFKRGKIDEVAHDTLIINAKSDLQALKVLIKTDDKTTCKNFIDLIDELKITQVGVVAPVDMMGSEYELLKTKLPK